MSIYWNWQPEDRKQAEADAAELFDRHERTWHADAFERLYYDRDAAIDAVITHEYECAAWIISCMGDAAYERWCRWNWPTELGRMLEPGEKMQWSACAAASNQPVDVDPEFNSALTRLIVAGRFNK